MRRRGRPILGALAGLLLGVFAALDLHVFGVWALSKSSETVLPLAGLTLGLFLGTTAPLGRRRI